MMKFCRTLGWMGIFVTLGWLASQERPLLGAEQAGSAAPQAKEKKSTYRRLPPYYAQVVDAQKRKAIYAIQEEYGPKIDALQAQLEALIRERDEKIASLLTEEQRKQVERLREEAKAKRAAAKEKQAASAESKVSVAPETPKEPVAPEKAKAIEKTSPEKPAPLPEEKPQT